MGVFIRYYVWGVLVKSFIREWVVVRKRLGGNILREGMFNYSW